MYKLKAMEFGQVPDDIEEWYVAFLETHCPWNCESSDG